MTKTGVIGAQGRAKLKDKLGEKFLDLLILHGLHPEDLPEELAGREVHIPQVNFDVPLEQQVRAKMGPPPYAIRGKLMEDSIAALHRDLASQWRKVAKVFRGDAAQFSIVWKSLVEAVDLSGLNALIKEHNTFYPIEANLQADPETGKIMIGATVWKPQKKVTMEDLLEKFPPDLDRALKGD